MDNQNDFYAQERYQEEHGAQLETLGKYTAKTFLWMFLGLAVTFVVAWFGYSTRILLNLIYNVPSVPFILLIAELGVVMVLASKIQSLSVGMARVLFILYAMLNGVVFSTYFLMYNVGSLMLVFGMTSLYFGALALFGFFTKVDLSRMRFILVGGLILLLAFWVLSIFLNLQMFETAMCMVGIAVFLGFTAYDTQKIKAYHAAYSSNPDMAKKASIFSALQLYLDFINLFIYLLRILGRSRK